jgi:maltooligosyltrehalose trehalohydrolase
VSQRRRYRVGPEIVGPASVSLRVWAPERRRVRAVVGSREWPMERDGDGYWIANVDAVAGDRYGFRLDDEADVIADPASRWQPDGVEGRSAIWDPSQYVWGDHDWPGVALPGQVLYELHVGTFTVQGTYRAAQQELPKLRDLGVTVLQMMPIGAFNGAFGWGYDGVFWCAPLAAYGPPEDLQRFVDHAHKAGLGVVLDVVFNHLGPVGNVLPRYSPHYMSDRHETEWGAAVNFDGEQAHGMRELVLSAVDYWVREFHIDGFRLDAAQALHDESPEHIVTAIVAATRAAASPRRTIVIAEHEPQHARLMRPVKRGGLGVDGVFHEDLHHSMRVALTGVREAYFSDTAGTSREWLSSALHGFLYQGQYYSWQAADRGEPALDCARWRYVAFMENHDQVANGSAGRLRHLSSPACWRALSALLLLGPWTPLIFQGQEWGAEAPFRYFSDHDEALQQAVWDGRRAFLAQFSRRRADAAVPASDAIGRTAFEASRLSHPKDPESIAEWRLYRDALALRSSFVSHDARLLGSTLSDRVLLLRYHGTQPGQLLVVNLGPDLALGAQPDPLVAPPEGCLWQVQWCSQDPCYGGTGVANGPTPGVPIATGHATTLFVGAPRS